MNGFKIYFSATKYIRDNVIEHAYYRATHFIRKSYIYNFIMAISSLFKKYQSPLNSITLRNLFYFYFYVLFATKRPKEKKEIVIWILDEDISS